MQCLYKMQLGWVTAKIQLDLLAIHKIMNMTVLPEEFVQKIALEHGRFW